MSLTMPVMDACAKATEGSRAVQTRTTAHLSAARMCSRLLSVGSCQRPNKGVTDLGERTTSEQAYRFLIDQRCPGIYASSQGEVKCFWPGIFRTAACAQLPPVPCLVQRCVGLSCALERVSHMTRRIRSRAPLRSSPPCSSLNFPATCALSRSRCPVTPRARPPKASRPTREPAPPVTATNLDDGEFAPPLKGVDFRLRWGGKPVEALFDEVTRTMPPGSPGSLGEETYSAGARVPDSRERRHR